LITGEWKYSLEHSQLCRDIETQTLWGETICRVWLPDPDAIVRVPSDQLKPLDDNYARIGSHQIKYIAATGRLADALTHDLSAGQADVLLAPIESSVIPLPHQIRALSRAISNDRVQ